MSAVARDFVARMEARGTAIRDAVRAVPDSAALHPGYVGGCTDAETDQ